MKEVCVGINETAAETSTRRLLFEPQPEGKKPLANAIIQISCSLDSYESVGTSEKDVDGLKAP